MHGIDLFGLDLMVATSSDPTNGARIDDLGEVRIEIAYGGSRTAGKEADLDQYAQAMGSGQLYLASSLTVVASAVAGRIAPYREGIFA